MKSMLVFLGPLNDEGHLRRQQTCRASAAALPGVK
jgi:hypothetical protein